MVWSYVLDKIVDALFGYLLLDETLDEVQLAGALVTVVGIYLVNTRASEAEEAPAGEE